jgi:hypothetical protein
MIGLVWAYSLIGMVVMGLVKVGYLQICNRCTMQPSVIQQQPLMAVSASA